MEIVPILYDCSGNREPITLSKSEILKLKSPRGLFCNFFFVISKTASNTFFYLVVKCHLRSELPQIFLSTFLACIVQTVYAYAMLLCSLDEDYYHGLIELEMERERGWKGGSLFFKWLHFSHRNPIDPT